MELVFSCQNYTKEKKVRLATIEFCGYAINWWDQLGHIRRWNEEPQVTSWYKMKTVVKKHYVSSRYGRDLHQRLKRLTQGTKSVNTIINSWKK